MRTVDYPRKFLDSKWVVRGRNLSCYWNQADRHSSDPAVIRVTRVGQNVIEFATGGKLPPDKLSVR
jgi:hypothetical protein